MPIVVFVSTLFFIFALGLTIGLLLGFREKLELWGLAWLLGMGAYTFVWFLLYRASGISFTLTSLLGTLVLSNLVGWSLLLITNRNLIRQTKVSISWRAWPLHTHLRYLSLGLVFLCSFVLFENTFWPVTDWDALALYDFRAKVILSSGTLLEKEKLEYFYQYPLFTSLLHTTTYLTGVTSAKVWYALIYQALLAVFYSILRKRSSHTVSLLGTLLLATSPLIYKQAFAAYTNLAYTSFIALGFIYLWQWWSNHKSNYLVLGALLVGLSTWCRISEPFYLVAAILVLAGTVWQIKYKKISMRALGTSFLAWGLILLLRYPWDAFVTSVMEVNWSTPTKSLALVSTWELSAFAARSGEVLMYLFHYSLPVYGWYVLPALGLAYVDLKRKNMQLLISWITMVALLATIFIGTLLLSFSLESWNRIGDSLARMSLFLVPLWIYIIFGSPSWPSTRKKA